MAEDEELVFAVPSARERRMREHADAMEAFALRVMPVCRNCIHAGPLSASGNFPHDNAWGSCQNGAPRAADHATNIEQYTTANTARWPAVHHSDTCGSFKLRPLPDAEMAWTRHINVSWSWQAKRDA